MTFDPTLPVQTRDGRKAEVHCTDFHSDKYGRTIVAGIELTGEILQGSFLYHSNGRIGDYGDPHPCDLINIPEKRWVNVYDNSLSGQTHTSRESADDSAKSEESMDKCKRIACLEFTEGDGL